MYQGSWPGRGLATKSALYCPLLSGCLRKHKYALLAIHQCDEVKMGFYSQIHVASVLLIRVNPVQSWCGVRGWLSAVSSGREAELLWVFLQFNESTQGLSMIYSYQSNRRSF